MKEMTLIFHGRFPGEKAGSLFAAKSAESFADAGYSVTLLVPRRLSRVRKSVGEYWGIRENFTVRFLPIFDLYSVPVLRAVAFPISYATFTISVFVYVLFTRRSKILVYSNEMLPLLAASFIARRTVLEVHDYPGRLRFLWRVMFARVSLIVATNRWKADALAKDFGVPRTKILVEQNAVDIAAFSLDISRVDARQQLGLPKSARIVLYTGHLYSWKGVDTLAEAAKLVPEASFYFVGGTSEDVALFRKKYSAARNMSVVGHRPHSEIPLWQRAADVLVLPNTGKEPISERYTSPMKLFEYMASGTPIVASDIPSVREIVREGEAYMVRPDNPSVLAEGILAHQKDPDAAALRAHAARKSIEEHTWRLRAERIAAAIEICRKS